MTTASNRALRDPRDTLRGAVARVGEQLAMGNPSPGLLAAWTALVDALALGSAPELRECPSCGNTGMRAATRCGYCWVALIPPADVPKTAP